METSTDWLPSALPPNGDQAPNQGMCPDYESNLRPHVHESVLNHWAAPAVYRGQFGNYHQIHFSDSTFHIYLHI